MESLMFLGALTVLFTLGTAAYLLGCASRLILRQLPRELAYDCRRTYWSVARGYA